jgi:hypothetical protein
VPHHDFRSPKSESAGNPVLAPVRYLLPTEQAKDNLRLYGVSVSDAELPGALMEIACYAFTELELARDAFDKWSLNTILPVYQEWWANHKLRDAERMKVVKEIALAKLTKEEKRALGLCT